MGVNGENNPVFISADATTIYDLYGEHNKPTAGDIGAVPTSRTVNGKALSSNITLSASDVGAAATSHGNHVPTTQTASNRVFLRNDNTWQIITPENIGAISNNVFNSGGTAGTSGYVAFAQLTITSAWSNRPIEFELICRGRTTPCYISVGFINDSSTDPNLNNLVYWGTDYGVFAHKTGTSTWLLYYTKSEGYDSVTVARVQNSESGIAITYPDAFITTAPTSNIIHASLGGNIGYASSAGSASSAGTLSSTLPVNKGGTGTTSLTSGAALIGAGTGAVTTRAISNVTTNSTCAASTNLITANTLNYHVIKMLNRDTTVTGADTNYTSTKARGIDLLTYVPSSMINGAISLVYS